MIEIGVGVVPDPPLVGTPSGVVLRAVSPEHTHIAVVHQYRQSHLDFTPGFDKHRTHVVFEIETPNRSVNTRNRPIEHRVVLRHGATPVGSSLSTGIYVRIALLSMNAGEILSN